MEQKPSTLKDGCLLTLRYFGIFRYPLTTSEIHLFNGVKSTLAEVRRSLDELKDEGEIFHKGDYYLAADQEEWVKKREKGNRRAYQLLDSSRRYATIIASFPFVRGICISGSLSKYYASESTDIDYFIITAANRLWIARSFLHLFKKLTFLTGHQHYFCMNYFVDTRALSITHKNIYSAVETATLIPVYNEEVYKAFIRQNQWFKEYLPNYPDHPPLRWLMKKRRRPLKRILEWILQLLFPERMNQALMDLTDSKWRRKWHRKGYPEEEYNRAFLTELHISKNHPVDYEKEVLGKLSQSAENLSIPV